MKAANNQEMSKMRIAIINGPNLSHIGHREPEIYGLRGMDDLLQALCQEYPHLEIAYYQSNHEGVLIDQIYQCQDEGASGIILNAGAYTHTSIALLDAIRACGIPVIEVHLSNIYAREVYRHSSIIAPACLGVIAGLGLESYRLALIALLDKAKASS